MACKRTIMNPEEFQKLACGPPAAKRLLQTAGGSSFHMQAVRSQSLVYAVYQALEYIHGHVEGTQMSLYACSSDPARMQSVSG